MQFSKLVHDVPVGKLLSLNSDGTLNSETNGRLESAVSHLIDIDHIHDLIPIIQNANGHEHLVTGVTGHKEPVGVYPNAYVQGSVARDNKHYKAPKGAGLLVIDSDNITESIHDKLVQVCPEIGQTACIETTSSSGMIYTPEKWLRGFTGTHTFIGIKDANDSKRSINVLHKRAILNGYGQHRSSAVGGFLERSFVDTMLDKPSQPIYLKPNLGNGIYQDKKIVKFDGEPLLDTKKCIHDLTPYEEEMFDALIMAAQMEMKAECDAKREQWISQQPNKETAEKALETRTLDGAFMIHTAHQGSHTVHDILMEPHRFNRQTCRDPFDMDGGSKTKAMIFTDQSRAMINSHAHGGCVYQLLDPTMVGFGKDRVPATDLYPDLKLGGDYKAPIQSVTPPYVPEAVTISDTADKYPNPVQPDTDIDVPEAAYGISEPIAENSWFVPHCNSQGKPRTTMDIFKFMLQQYGISIGYNVIGKSTLMLGQGMKVRGDLKENANHGILDHLCEMNQLKSSKIDSFISTLMMENEVNPVTNWVGSKPWDGETRVRALFDTLNVKENEMSYTLFVKWMMGALRLAKGEIASFEHVLVLQASEGGEGKTRWFSKLTPQVLNNSMSLRLDDKDQLKEAVSYWLVELGELDSTFQKSEIKALMGFLSKHKDNIRLPYAKANNEYQRRTSYFGTVNNKNFLIDDSGDRRFWILETGDINYNHNIDVQQVWAEIDTMDEQEWLTREENNKIIEINKEYKMADPLSDMMDNYFSRNIVREGTQHVNATVILKKAGIMNPTKAQLNKCGRWLREKGYENSLKSINGKKIRGYDIPYFNEQLL